ncbi:uncharacterized protein LOC128735405 [Sabethes cyaneus]|uniref:uncharacterized protein LOC128735405 n=1 Tax=Sabethes cyaneus TaxID=53552 RepID=UPI00237E385B|nr:uncharacterized protein LOC128735405 [Sabethes cyaneus]
MDNINDLPVEILERILSYLNFSDRKSACGVCSHWHNVLRTVRFQRQCRIHLSNEFDQELSDIEMRVIQNYRNMSLSLYSDDSDDDEDNEQREDEGLIHLKYLFVPCPEINMKKLLFGRFDLEALTLYCSFEGTREILENQLADMINLRELELFTYTNKYSSPDQSVWVIHHDRLKSLKIDIKTAKPLKIVLPHLTKLELLFNCRYSFLTIETYCWQLQSLIVHFRDPETMDDMMSLSFPMLTHLEVCMEEDKDVQLGYAQTRNKFADKEKEENFIKSIPKLRSMVIGSNLFLYRIGMALSKFSHQLEELTLQDLKIDTAELQSIEKLAKIKTIVLLYTKIISPTQNLPKLYMPHLHHLSLLYHSSNIIFDSGLAGLKILKLILDSERNDKVLHKICNNLLNLERLELVLYNKWRKRCLRHLNNLKKLRTLRISYCDSDIYWTHCPVVPSLQTIIVDNCYKLRTETLQPISRLFPGLVSIYLDDCVVTGSDEDDVTISANNVEFDETEEGKQRCYEQLKLMLPQCIISLDATILRWQCCK